MICEDLIKRQFESRRAMVGGVLKGAVDSPGRPFPTSGSSLGLDQSSTIFIIKNGVLL